MTIRKARAMSERFTATVQAEALHELASALSMRPIPGSCYRVTVEEVEATDDEKLAVVRAAIQKGRDEIAAGHFVNGGTAFTQLAAKHFPNKLK